MRALVLLAGLLLSPHPLAHAAEPAAIGRSQGQRLYVPIYSSAPYLEGQILNFAVTVSFRNTDAGQAIAVEDIRYFGTDGTPHGNPLGEVGTLAPMASAQLTIPQSAMAGDVGANLIVEWRAPVPVTPPLIEAVMLGSSRAQGFSFTSRAVVLEELR